MRIFIDGAVRHHQQREQRRAYIAVVADGEQLVEAVGNVTNNQAEYLALLRALKLARQHAARNIEIFSDSQLLVRQVQGQYRVRSPSIKSLQEQVQQLWRRFDAARIMWVPRAENLAGRLLESKGTRESDLIRP